MTAEVFICGIVYFYIMFIENPSQLSYKPGRIISLVPSQTELLHYLGLESETIAITKFCIHPPEWFKNKTKIGGTKALDIKKINSLGPDLIISNKEENVKEQVETLAGKYPVWVTDVNNLQNAYEMIADIGTLTGKGTEACNLTKEIQNKFDNFLKQKDITVTISAIYLIWKEPYMTIGGDTFISNMMEAAGFENVYKKQERYPVVTIGDIKKSGAKMILLSSEPYPFRQKHIEEIQTEVPGIKLILVDGEMFSWYGSRLLLAPGYFSGLVQKDVSD